ncbi:MAG TPA: cytochrome c3 family protein [Polyangia bacterium]
MAFAFPPWADTAFRVGLIGFALAVPGVFVVPIVYVRTPYNLDRHFPIEQPVQFDHRHHAQDDEIPCLYCHAGAERTPYAGVPPTELCMGCHGQIWNKSPMLEPIRRSYFSGRPIPWNRVHGVPDFVYFNHAIHVTGARVDCVECHGDVRTEPLVARVRLFTMGWCLDCHRRREGILAPAAQTDEPSTADAPPRQGGRLPPLALGGRPALRPQARLTTCTTCHR